MSQPIITVFRNRLRPENAEHYRIAAAEMTALARRMPGFVDSKTFMADDGERVTIVVFEDEVSHNEWRDHPDHKAAQRRGVAEFYSEYVVQVGSLTYENKFVNDTSAN